jgi:hypothetical protein
MKPPMHTDKHGLKAGADFRSGIFNRFENIRVHPCPSVVE